MREPKLASKQYSNTSEYLPNYGYMIDEDILTIGQNKLMALIKIDGNSFELEEDYELKARYQRLKAFLLTLGQDLAGKVELYFYIDRQKVVINEQYHFENAFIHRFAEKYMERFTEGGNFFKTTYYISLVLNYSSFSLQEAKKKMHQYLDISSKILNFTSVSRLKANVSNNETATFLSWLLNHDRTAVPFSDALVKNCISFVSDIYFGNDIALIRHKNRQTETYLATYLLGALPPYTQQGILDFLLDAPCEFTLTQSFAYLKQMEAIEVIQKQQNKINSSSMVNDEELITLDHAQNLIQNNEIFTGKYHCVLNIYGTSAKEIFESGNKLETAFGSRGYQLMRCNQEQQQAFLSIMPGSEKVLESFRTTTTIADHFSLHDTPIGKRAGNPIGDGSALIPVTTLQGGIHYLNTSTGPDEQNLQGRPIASHFLILGMTGTGKTVLQSSMASFMQRFNPMMFAIDFNQSMRLPMLMMGAKYFVLRDGIYSGLNPFQLDATILAQSQDAEISTNKIEQIEAQIKQFCYSLVERAAVGATGRLEDGDAVSIKVAVDAVFNLPISERRFNKLLKSIEKRSSLYARLAVWCEDPVTGEKGRFAWALDSKRNVFDPISMDKIGFDGTQILKRQADGSIHPAWELILASLFFYKDLMQVAKAKQGRWTLFTIEEFWMPANFPLTAEAIKASLKAGRLKYEICGLISQSPSDALKCSIFEAIVEQTPTKILLPNPAGNFEDYRQVGLTTKEFEKFKSLTKDSRTFLIKKSDVSVFGVFDLSGFDEFLPILSGDTEGIAKVEEIINQINSDDPRKWLPIFLEQNRRQNRGN